MSKTRSSSGKAPSEATLFGSIENYILNSQYKQALDQCNLLLATSSSSETNVNLLYTKARIELGCRNFQSAWETLKSIPSGQTNANILTLKSQVEMYLGRHLESLFSANLAISMDHSIVGAYVFKAQALKHLYRDSEAAETLREGINQVKSIHGVRSVKSDIEKSFLARLCQEYDIGIKYAKYIIDQAPKYSSGYVHLGINYLLKFMSTDQGETISSPISSSAASQSSARDSRDIELYEKAVNAFKRAIELNPFDSIATYYLGVAEDSVGNNDKALELYHKAAEMSPGYSNAVLALVKIHMLRGENEEALEHINQLLDINRSEEALLAKAKALESSGSNDEALVILDELIRVNELNHYYFYRKAVIHAAKGEYQASLTACDAALTLKPSDEYVLHQKVLTLTQLDEFSQAMDTVSEILSKKPNFAMAHESRGYVLSEIATEPVALSFEYFYNNLREEEKTTEVSNLLSRKAISIAEIWYYNRINNANDRCYDLYSIAQELMDSGSFDEATSVLREAIEINPDFQLAKVKLSICQRKLGFTEEADSIIESLAGKYGDFLKGIGKLPHIEIIEADSISSFDNAIRLDPKNPILYSSKASALGKFQKLDEMIAAAEKVEELMAKGYGATLAPDQVEYILEQNKLKIELFREVKKLANSTKMLHDTMRGSVEFFVIQSTEEVSSEGLADTIKEPGEIHHHHSLFKVQSSRLLASLPSMREIDIFRSSSGHESRPKFSSSDFVTPKASLGSTSFGSGQSLASMKGEASPTEGVGTFVVSSSSAKVQFKHFSPSSLSDDSPVTKPIEFGLPKMEMTEMRLKAVTHRELSASPPVHSHASASASASAILPTSRLTQTVSFQDENPDGYIDTARSHSTGQGFLDHLKSAVTTSVSQEASITKPSSHQPKDLAALTMAAMKVHSSLKASAASASVSVLKQQVQELRSANAEILDRYKELTGQLQSLSDGLKYSLAHDAELSIWSAEAKAVDSDPMLSQYRDGFTKSFQKFMVGCLARTSSLVGDKSYEIPGLSYIPLPPVADQLFKIIETAGGIAAQIREDRQVTTTLSSISNPLHFATNVIPKIASKLALMPEKGAIIRFGAREERCGIFKIIDVYEGLKNYIWGTDTPTYASQLGAEDAIKIIAIFKSGGLNIYGSQERDADNISRVITAYIKDSFKGVITKDDLESSSRHQSSGQLSEHSGDAVSTDQVSISLPKPAPIEIAGVGAATRTDAPDSAHITPLLPQMPSAPHTIVTREKWSEWFARKLCCCFQASTESAIAPSLASDISLATETSDKHGIEVMGSDLAASHHHE